MMCGSQDSGTEASKPQHVQGLKSILARFGYSEAQLSRVLEDCGCNGERSMSITLEEVRLN